MDLTDLQDESKLWMELHLLVSYLDVAALLDGESAKQGVQHWVNRLPNVLKQETVPTANCSLYGIKVPKKCGSERV